LEGAVLDSYDDSVPSIEGTELLATTVDQLKHVDAARRALFDELRLALPASAVEKTWTGAVRMPRQVDLSGHDAQKPEELRKVPFAQPVHAVPAALSSSGAGQVSGMHSPALVAVAVIKLICWPDGQLKDAPVQSATLDEPALSVDVPLGHVAHVKMELAATAPEYVPRLHAVHEDA
jgi:hypothetical protein